MVKTFNDVWEWCSCYNVLCVLHADNPRLCENGELSQMHVTLNICVDGNWRTLCPSLWGPSQAMVACRQLNPGRTVIGKRTIYIQHRF